MTMGGGTVGGEISVSVGGGATVGLISSEGKNEFLSIDRAGRNILWKEEVFSVGIEGQRQSVDWNIFNDRRWLMVYC